MIPFEINREVVVCKDLQTPITKQSVFPRYTGWSDGLLHTGIWQ